MHKLSNGESHRFTDPVFLDAMSDTGKKKAVLDLGVASKDLRDVRRDDTPCYTKFGEADRKKKCDRVYDFYTSDSVGTRQAKILCQVLRKNLYPSEEVNISVRNEDLIGKDRLIEFLETESMKCVRQNYGIRLALKALDEDDLKEMILRLKDLSGVELGIGGCDLLIEEHPTTFGS